MSATSPDHPGYRLVRDPDVPDALSGWDDDGQGWTIQVPGNRIVRGEDVPVPRAPALPSGHADWGTVSVSLEDPGRGMNERNQSNVENREALARTDALVY